MPIVRKFFLGVAASALVFLLFVTALDVSLVRVASSPEPIKKILAESGIYQSAIPSTLEQAKKQSGNQTEIPLSQAAIMTAAEETFTPQLVQTNVEQFIDGIYHWLNGKTNQPDFRLDLSGAKVTFADKVAQIAKARAASLPICATLPSTTTVDVFNASCLPKFITPDQVAAEARDTILHGQGFLNNPVITADTLKSKGSDKSIFAEDQLKQAPDIYQAVMATPAILSLLIILAVLAVILLSRPRLAGLRRVGLILAGTGLIVVILALTTTSAVKNRLVPKISLDNKVLQADLRRLANDAVQRIDNTTLAVGGGYIILGALGVGGYYFYSRRPNVKR